jgi:hypothetical protein
MWCSRGYDVPLEFFAKNARGRYHETKEDNWADIRDALNNGLEFLTEDWPVGG